jgi:hypothetical protein
MGSLFWVVVLALSISRVASPGESGQSAKTIVTTARAEIIRDFSDRVKAYVKLRKNVEESLARPKSSRDSAEIATHKTALAAMIVATRSDAHQGDIFTPDIAEHFRDVIRKTLQTSGSQAVRRTIQDKDPAKPVVIRVNSVYPEDSPLQTMPPTLLGRLPDLSSDMAYRIIDRSLVLLDNKTRLIVDFIPDALP